MDDLVTQDVGEAQLFEIATPGGSITYAMGDGGRIFLNGDIHPLGAPQAIAEALHEDVEWVQVGAVGSYFPLEWLLAKCDSSPERILILGTLERFIRGRG